MTLSDARSADRPPRALARSFDLTRAAGFVTSGRLSLSLVWVASAIYLRLFLNRGWFPHDDGALAQSAERVVLGQLPHRDYSELYTGGLTFLHALAFSVFGVELSSMRLILFAAFLAWIPAVFAIARRFVSPWAASAVVALAVVWSVPNYSAPMPSWYSLFFATFAVLALIRYAENGRRRWIFGAGLACGGSAVIKLPPGFYTLIGVLLALAFLEQVRDQESTGRKVRRSGYALVVAGFGAGVVVLLVALVGQRAGAAEIVDFVLPAFAVAAALVWNELRVRRGALRERLRAAGGSAAVAIFGAALPVAAFLVPYVATGSIGSLVEGVLIKPADRFEFAAFDAPPLRYAWAGLLPLAVLVGIARIRPRRTPQLGAAVVASLLVLLLVLPGRDVGLVASLSWSSARWGARVLIPLAFVLLVLEARRRSPVPSRRDGPLLALLSITAMSTLVQFPFAAPIYFAYVAPLFLLTTVALADRFPEQRRKLFPRSLVVPLTMFAIVVAAIGLNPDFFHANTPEKPARATLDLPRAANIVVTAEDRRTYGRIAQLVEQHAGRGAIYAAPDAPEVYFLTGRKNVTPFLLDFLDPPRERERVVRAALARSPVTLVVINRRPEQSPPLSPALRHELERTFPQRERVGRFEVRWRA